MKARRSNRKVTPFGGVVPVLKQIRDFKIPELIKDSLGTRVKQAKYGYEDVIISWMLTNLCGGERLDHITKLRKSLNIIPGLKLPSHDTLGRVMKSLATEVSVEEDVVRGKLSYQESKRKGKKTDNWLTIRETNRNDKLNRLLVKTTKAMGLLKEGQKYILDMDATAIVTNCYEAKKNYKKQMGFMPMVSTIDKMPVYIEMRSGNVAPGARIQECVESTIDLLWSQKIDVGSVRMDAAGYRAETFDYLENEGYKFYVGGVKRPNIMKLCSEHSDWSEFSMETSTQFWECEAADIPYRLHDGKHKFRLVVLRANNQRPRKTPKTWIYTKEFAYKIVITNDFDSSASEIMTLYNQRGTSEKNFDILKNDFGWRLPPFSNMNQNTVFLSIAALTNNVYLGLTRKFKKKIKQLRTNARLREFIFVFMSVSCELKKNVFVFYDTDIAYEKIC